MASTYVNDLRLNEMATGDASGTWGTTTNLNLELIGEAFGYGTEAITTNADTHTSTIADGATDPVRAHYVKYTGTLDSACTITIAPNTVNRFHIIENGTSGSQNIIIKQGTGDDVTIAPGTAKAVYLDGAGSGADVVDAFSHLAVVDLTVDDDLTVADDIILNSDSSVISMGAGADATLTHDGTTGLTIAANPITIDSDADIVLDANGADIVFKDDGTSILTITNNSTDVEFTVATQDKDIIFKGDDGGSPITALTLDMSDAGTASFNHDIALIDGAIIDCAGDLTIDVAGADLHLADDGTTFGEFTNSSSDFVIKSTVNDKDMIFKGVDNSSAITALTLDMSGAGAATFNNDVTAFSDKRLKNNITNIENGLEKVTKMQGVYYQRTDVENARTQVGVLAQDMETIVPEVVLTADDEMQTKSVDYGKLTAVLIEAVKELTKRVEELENGVG